MYSAGIVDFYIAISTGFQIADFPHLILSGKKKANSEIIEHAHTPCTNLCNNIISALCLKKTLHKENFNILHTHEDTDNTRECQEVDKHQ